MPEKNFKYISNPWLKKEILMEIRKNFELNNKNSMYHNLLWFLLISVMAE